MHNNNEQKNKTPQLPIFKEIAHIFSYQQLPSILEALQAQKEQFFLYLDTQAADDTAERRRMVAAYKLSFMLYNVLKNRTVKEFNIQCNKIATNE